MTSNTYRNQFHKILAKKREWDPITPSNVTAVPGTEEVFKRILSLRILELPVGQMIQTASSKEAFGLPTYHPDYEDCQLLMDSNIKDEDVHDEALNNLTLAGGFQDDECDAEAARILKSWEELDEHEVSKARIIESGCFFPILIALRYLGSISARQIAEDISGDEINHVLTNWIICEKLKIERISNANRRLRRQSVSWMFEPLLRMDKAVINSFPESRRKYLSYDFWLRQSDNLAQRGVANELSETRNTRFKTPFETNKKNQGLYKPQVYR